MVEKNANTQADEPIVKQDWWELPFDDSLNFSLLGFLYGGAYWTGNPDKRVDLTLED